MLSSIRLPAAVRLLVGAAENVRSRTSRASNARSSSRRSMRPSTSSCGSPTRSRSCRGSCNAGPEPVRTSAVVGDYAAGATHVLPTGGLARGAGGIGLETFPKPVQMI